NDLLISGDLEVDGNAYFDGTTNFVTASASLFYAGNGTAASPSFSFRADQDTGMWRPTTNTLALSTLGVERFRIDSAGRVGIGTTAPTTMLEVQGTASASHLLTTGGLQVAGGASVSYSRFGTATTGHSLAAASDLLLSGNLEVDGNAFFDGSASISSRLEIGGTASVSGALSVGGVINTTAIGTAAAPAIALSGTTTGFYTTSGILAVSVGGSAKLGINTDGAFDLNSGGAVYWRDNATWISGTRDTGLSRISAGLIGVGTGSAASFAGSLKLTDLTALGNIGIGTTTPLTKLEVQGTASASHLLTTGGLQVAGGASVSYSRFGTAATGHSLSVASDLLISGMLEVDGQAYFDGSASVSTNFEVSGFASASKTFGSGLTDCDVTSTSKLLWDATTGKFSCSTDQTGGGSGSALQIKEGLTNIL
ncbi:MAG: hypothetical protein AAB512_05490, partial [Patescibacteria group bacterium]